MSNVTEYRIPPLVVLDITNERAAQDRQWGGPGHDDEHTGWDWRDFIQHQILCAAQTPDSAEERQRFIKIAALAIAAVESFDRKART